MRERNRSVCRLVSLQVLCVCLLLSLFFQRAVSFRLSPGSLWSTRALRSADCTGSRRRAGLSSLHSGKDGSIDFAELRKRLAKVKEEEGQLKVLDDYVQLNWPEPFFVENVTELATIPAENLTARDAALIEELLQIDAEEKADWEAWDAMSAEEKRRYIAIGDESELYNRIAKRPIYDREDVEKFYATWRRAGRPAFERLEWIDEKTNKWLPIMMVTPFYATLAILFFSAVLGGNRGGMEESVLPGGRAALPPFFEQGRMVFEQWLVDNPDKAQYFEAAKSVLGSVSGAVTTTWDTGISLLKGQTEGGGEGAGGGPGGEAFEEMLKSSTEALKTGALQIQKQIQDVVN
uniref:Uncharacterized protein n=1 Tax=Chromera velia CCMP2878 TaxID=1169474 RepID=A0A0G4HUF3_9ALVE|eukprot:Cvel_8640.t1-p1 / transcript=Cvel_8640.t1 / gene=Cvel_8640 / organism=Chromera_velia_CCMP2878 / gene_product=hypothetical protein / transcript_product=hypothetical protein / location=Cvel_scaffold481:54778-55818(+) / protein_length=347 / sequence_SO=supercontig / SO=protein_coding / is_pseudo=false